MENRGTPIVYDPAIVDLLTSPGPSPWDFERRSSREVEWSDFSSDIETLGDLIDVLEGYRDRLGGGAQVKDDECGLKIHTSAKQYDDGEAIVRL